MQLHYVGGQFTDRRARTAVRRARPERLHVAAVCYRVSDDEIQFLLVRTQSGKWTFPKGGVDDDATFAAAASREAFEEAGVRGHVEHRPFASYVHCKSSALKRREVEVSAHLCRVSHVGRALEPHRDPTWFSFEAAKKRVRDNRRRKYAAELERVLEQAMERIRRRTRQ